MKLFPQSVDRVPTPPLDGGRLLNAKQVADEIFMGHVTAAWVRRNVPNKIRLGHSTVCWYEYDVLAWIHNQRVEA